MAKSNFLDGWKPMNQHLSEDRKKRLSSVAGAEYDPNKYKDYSTVSESDTKKEAAKLRKRGNKLAKDTKYMDPANQGQVNDYVANNNFDLKTLGRKHPFNDPKNHDRLLKHVIERIQLSRETRDQFAIRLRTVDLDINGFLRLSDQDKDRLVQNRAGKSPKPISVNLPLVMSKMDELLTFLLEAFWPNQGMYQAYGTKSQQQLANGFSLALNKQAEKRGHYSNIARFLWDAVKYNFAAIEIKWVKDDTYKLGSDEMGQRTVKEAVFEGNELHVLDCYNFFWDPSVHPVELSAKGEYCFHVELKSKFAVKKAAAGGELHGIERFIDNVNDFSVSYYYEKPIVRFDYNSYTGSVDWMRFASGGKYQTIGTGIELITGYMWLNPSDFGLSDADEYQVWKIVVANHQYIVAAEYMEACHNRLPIEVTIPYADGLGLQMKSAAEQIMDFQRYASFLMNVDQISARKALYGKTAYDPTIINLGEQDEVGGHFPVNPAGYGKDLKNSIFQFDDKPRTEDIPDKIEKLMALMESVMPTNIAKQVADLDRATTYQAAATVQGANRRNLKMAKVVEDQAVRWIKFQCMYNMLYHQNKITVIDKNGAETEVDLSKIREKGMEFAISAGLENLDKLMLIHFWQSIVNSVLQSQQAQQEIDIVMMLNYFTDLIGDKVDLDTFRKQAPNPQEQQEQQLAQGDQQHQQQMDKVGAINDLAKTAIAAKSPGPGTAAPGAGGT